MIMCDKDNNRMVESAEFINEFFKLGKLEKDKFFAKHKNERKRLAALEAKYEAERRDRINERLRYKMKNTWSEAEEESAMSKIRHAAFSHKSGNMSFLQVCTLGTFNQHSLYSLGFHRRWRDDPRAVQRATAAEFRCAAKPCRDGLPGEGVRH